jgi:hypothetical protein
VLKPQASRQGWKVQFCFAQVTACRADSARTGKRKAVVIRGSRPPPADNLTARGDFRRGIGPVNNKNVI